MVLMSEVIRGRKKRMAGVEKTDKDKNQKSESRKSERKQSNTGKEGEVREDNKAKYPPDGGVFQIDQIETPCPNTSETIHYCFHI